MKKLPGKRGQQDERHTGLQQLYRWELGVQQKEPHQPNPKDPNGAKAITSHQAAKLYLGQRQQQRYQGQEPWPAPINAADDDRDQDNSCK